MAKKADAYYAVEPWRVVERGFDPERAPVSESIFSLANEHMGVRGYFEEGGAFASLRGSYFGGVYEWGEDGAPGGYKGIVKRTHYMVNGPDWLSCGVRVDGERLCVGESETADFERALDLKTGELTRRFVWTLSTGKRVSVRFDRILSMGDARLACQRLTLRAEEACRAEIDLGVHGAPIHRMTGQSTWGQVDQGAEGARAWLTAETATTGQQVRTTLTVATGGALSPVLEDRYAGFRVALSLLPGRKAAVEKRVVNQVNEQGPAPEPLPYAELLQKNRAHYDAFWRASDVVIDGDPENQQGIRFCLFQLHQTYRGIHPKHNVGAKGLTGEAYNGHAFWDTETYCLPYYLLNDPKAAKNLLMFRHHTLENAMRRARELDCEGACYPIATLNGDEACTLWQHASLQMQPSTAVAYGVWHYSRLTGDTAFERGEGLSMLVQICRYLASRGGWNADRTHFGYYGVMGPDEFHMMVHHNYYTNLMAKKTLEYTLRVLEQVPDAPVPPQEKDAWRAMADRMLLLRREDGVFEQHEGFFSLPHIDVHKIPITDFPLYEHWSYDRIFRTDMIKQPDVLMALFLYPGDYTMEEKRANYAYYEPRCIHESSLSPSVHSILASGIGLLKEARDFFGFATRMDLDNFNRNTGEGLHLTSIAAAWVTIVYGFGGLRTDGDLPSLAPALPDGWTGYSFPLTIFGSALRVTVTEDGATVTRQSGDPVTLRWYGERIVV